MENLRLLVKGLLANIIFTVVLFISAGRMNYLQGWIFLSVNVLATIMNFLTIHKNSDLIRERSGPGEGIKSWDKLILGVSALVYVIIIVIAGLDSGRFQWTKSFGPLSIICGVILMIAGQVLFLAARSQNRFFSSVVRIQKDRGHVVCDTGLYKAVRHPGYLGMILSLAGLPLITSSGWSIIPATVAIILILIRTYLEDKTLSGELEGYAVYAQQTRYRLIPLIW